MHDCSADVLGYHDNQITLPNREQNEMRGRRNSNRDRLKEGLKKDGKQGPQEFKAQGSYAMRTMIQHPEKDYDIDDGVYFAKEQLVGPRGGEMSALDARQMVRDAVDDGSFKTPPEVKKNCVRVQYDAGYHVDLPVYRWILTTDTWGQETRHADLASSEWRRSDARDVTSWFKKENKEQSPDKSNGRQLRRMARDIKKFAQSRVSWKTLILSGFGITKLVTECYRKNAEREDIALYDTMTAIRDRLASNLVVKHPVTPGETITKENEDSKAKFLRDKLSEALSWLQPLLKSNCTREEALKCWDKVFASSYFIERLESQSESKAAAIAAPSILTSGLLKETGNMADAQGAVYKEGGGRYA